MRTYAAADVLAGIPRDRRSDRPREMRSPHATEREASHAANVDDVLNDSFPASDPPSWTGAISRVAAMSTGHHVNEALIGRVRAEYLEMPGLCLTIRQVQRLWGLETGTCEALLKSLIDSGFLVRTDRGLFVRGTPGQ